MKSILATANIAVKNNDFKGAVKIYSDALQHLDEPLKSQVQFNIMLAKRKLAATDQSTEIHKLKSFDNYDFELIEKSNLFNPDWYMEQYKEKYHIIGSPIAHYLEHGVELETNPSRYFNTRHYLKTHQDVKLSGMHPFLHYLIQGYKEGRSIVEEISVVTNSNIPFIKFDNTDESYQVHQNNEPIDSFVKILAFYLPQFHPFPENDKWWGKGFTEWSNVGKSVPNYEGHYQPHCPIHLGYYDLRISSVMEEQARLAKEYGIYGFSYYFYWFAGKTLMEAPLRAMLNNKNVDIPFCLTWANENWTRRWDGQENDVLIGQVHSENDSLEFIRYLVEYFIDPRYIRINGKPLLIVYRANIIPEIDKISQKWRDELVKHGINGIYLVSAQTFGIQSPAPFGFDASVEFPPHTVRSADISNELTLLNSEFTGKIYSYSQVVENAVRNIEPEYKLFRSTMLSWDNTARKQNSSHIFHGFSLLKYKQWLNSICSQSLNNNKYSNDEKIVFINAWNEWAEGTHLEPDRKYGYSYLKATYDVIKNYDKSKLSSLLMQETRRRSSVAVVLHVHYVDLWPEITNYLKNFGAIRFDLYVSTTNLDVIEKIKSEYPDSYIVFHENRGRDILPFINMLNTISSLGYTSVCKIHTKKSLYRQDGSKLRNAAYEALIGSASNIKVIVDRFDSNSNLGLMLPKCSCVVHSNLNMMFDNELVKIVCDHIGVDFFWDCFPAGSMFWFKPAALSKILLLNNSWFDIEKGLVDGTVSHAIERIFCVVVKSAGYTVETV